MLYPIGLIYKRNIIYDMRRLDLFYRTCSMEGKLDCHFIGGLVAPNQGVLPKYTAGLYVETEYINGSE